jgi:hypothetical protein
MTLFYIIFAQNLFPQNNNENIYKSLVGTEWIFIDDDENYEAREFPYIIRFSDYGILNVFLEKDTTPDNDTWTQNNNTVIFCYNDEYVKHEGEVINDNFIEGVAVNSEGVSWRFRLIQKGNW